jgi:hypothetical protein
VKNAGKSKRRRQIMMRSKAVRLTSLFFLMAMFMVFLGCGGGGGDSAAPPPTPPPANSISGVAAAGAPIVGTVTLKDSKGATKIVNVAADGKYYVDVTGMTPPFALFAQSSVSGRRYHSAAVSSDIGKTINITTFTDLIIANLAGKEAKYYYDDNTFTNLTDAQLEAKQAALREQLKPILKSMGIAETVDLLRTSFNADQTGLDAAIDIVEVTVDASNPNAVKATMKNKANNETVNVDVAAGGTATGAFTEDPKTKEAADDVKEIANFWAEFEAFFATSLPSPNNEQFKALFDAGAFMMSGFTLDEWLDDITKDNSMIGIKIQNIRLIKIDKTDKDNGTADINFTASSDSDPDPRSVDKMVKKNGKWLFAGNGRLADLSVKATARYMPSEVQDQFKFKTGLRFYVQIAHAQGGPVQSAVIKGPGLPDAGIILTRVQNSRSFRYDQYDSVYFMVNDNDILNIPDNAKYTFRLYDAANGAGNLLETSELILTKRPVLNSELAAAKFPSITAPTPAVLRAFNGGDITVTWTMPEGLSSYSVNIGLGGQGVNVSMYEYKNLKSTDRTAKLTLNPPQGFVVVNRWLFLQARDEFDRAFDLNLW